MPTERMPGEGEGDDGQPLLRPRVAFREWFAERGFTFDPSFSSEDRDVFRGEADQTRSLVANVLFREGFAYVSMHQTRDVYPWQEAGESRMDAGGLRTINEAHAFAKKLYVMERGIRRIGGVRTGGWRLPADAAATPGVGYAPPTPRPLGDPTPAWRQGFYH
jgi:hypothetical protein